MLKCMTISILLACILLTGCNDSAQKGMTIDETESVTISEEHTEQIDDVKKQISEIEKMQSIIIEKDNKIKELHHAIQVKDDEINTLEETLNTQILLTEENAQIVTKLQTQLSRTYSTENPEINKDLNVAPNELYATLIVTIDGGPRFGYLCNLITEDSKVLDTRVPAQTFWSSDSKYFILDEGTGQSRWGSIYLAENGTKIIELKYRGIIYWLNEHEVLYIEENRDIPINTGTELDCSTSIIQYNLDTGKISKLYEGNSEYYFYIDQVLIDGTYIISKNYLNSREAEKFSLKAN